MFLERKPNGTIGKPCQVFSICVPLITGGESLSPTGILSSLMIEKIRYCYLSMYRPKIVNCVLFLRVTFFFKNLDIVSGQDEICNFLDFCEGIIIIFQIYMNRRYNVL